MNKSKSKRKNSTPASKHQSAKGKYEVIDLEDTPKSTRKTPTRGPMSNRTPSKRGGANTPSRTGEKRIPSSSVKKTPTSKVKKEKQISLLESRRKSPRISTIKKEQSHSQRGTKSTPPKDDKIFLQHSSRIKAKVLKTAEKSMEKIKKEKRERSRSKSKPKTQEKLKSKKKTPLKVKEEKKTPAKQVIISALKIKEEPEQEEKSSSSNEEIMEVKKPISTATSGMKRKDISSHFSYGVNTQEITEEIEKIFKRIEDKKRAKGDIKLLGKKSSKKGKEIHSIKRTAKDYGYELQHNPNMSPSDFVDINELSTHPVIYNTEILLTLVEVAANSNYYLIDFSNRSKMFWEDVIQYKPLARIFDGYKSETLRKYWRILSKFEPEKISDLVKKHKKFLESMPIKLRTIVTSIAQFFEGKIDNLEEYIKNIQVDVRKQEIFQQEYRDPETGEITTIKDVRTTIRKRKKYEPGYKRQFIGRNYDNAGLEEIYGETEKMTNYQNVMKKLTEEDSSKFKYLYQFTEEEKKKLLQINEDDKFVFKVIDNVVDELCKEFKQYTRDYIFDMLVANSMNIGRTYLSLNDPKEKAKLTFSSIDDNVILNMKGSEQYENLVKEKGNELVEEREEFLKQ